MKKKKKNTECIICFGEKPQFESKLFRRGICPACDNTGNFFPAKTNEYLQFRLRELYTYIGAGKEKKISFVKAIDTVVKAIMFLEKTQ